MDSDKKEATPQGERNMATINRQGFIQYFNTKYGKGFTFNSKRINKRFDSIEAAGITEEDLYQYIEVNHSDDLYEIVDLAKLVDFKKSKKVETTQVQPEEERAQAQMGLGMLEKALARVMVEEYAPKLAEATYENIDNYIKATYGPIQRKISFELPQRKGKMEQTTHERFETVLKFVLADEPVMLVGPAGTGKNVICKQIAEAMNLEFYFSNAVTQEYKLTGFIDANGTYHETQFYKAFKDGGVFMLDEMDASIPEVLIILNSAIANRYFDFPTGKIEAHPDFRLVAAANTFGTGASYTYTGRNQLDGASLDRFAVINIDYSKDIENSLTDDKELLKFIRKFRTACGKNGINHIVSYRAITRLNKLKEVMELDELLKYCLLKNLEKDDLNMIVREFKDNSRWTEALKKVIE